MSAIFNNNDNNNNDNYDMLNCQKRNNMSAIFKTI